jgi:aryl-alcohol dehydrogenase-like predicted oxidoreductase
MRYRSFGNSGKAVSAVGLYLRTPPATAQACRDLIFTAMENGINCFEAAAGSEMIDRAIFESLAAVERRLLFILYRICGRPGEALSGQRLAQIVRQGLQRTAAGYFDVLMLDEAAYDALTPDGLDFLVQLRAGGTALQIGVSGEGPAADACIGQAPFEVLSTPFNLTSDWKSRRRVRDAAAAGMVAIAYDPMPGEMLKPAAAAAKPSLLDRVMQSNAAPADTGAYAFLHQTNGWSAEELCLGFALTEPSFATVQIEDAGAEAVEHLAGVAERELPTGAAAQIEMARFSVEPEPQKKRA